MNKEQNKALLNLDNLCILTYLIIGGYMLHYANSIPKFIISGTVLTSATIMIYIVYRKQKHLTGDLIE